MIEHASTAPFEQFMGFTYDQWMNASAGVGMMILFASFYITTHGWMSPMNPAIRFGRNVGFVLITLPLFSRWFLSKSLLLTIGVCVVVISAVKLLFARKGV